MFCTVRLELGFKTTPQWIARDADNNWRAYAEKSFATNAADAARAMFHDDEIVAVTPYGDRLAVVEIKVY
jgi:hypothetical protein